MARSPWSPVPHEVPGEAAPGASVSVTGRRTRASRSPMTRLETIEETADVIMGRGGRAMAPRVDHTVPQEGAALRARLHDEHNGRLAVLVNAVGGDDPLTEGDIPFWRHSRDKGLAMRQTAGHAPIITRWLAAALMVERRKGLIIEVPGGMNDRYRGSLFYGRAKAAALRLALAHSEDLRRFNVAAVALSPGFLRSEAGLDHVGVTEAHWPDATAQDEPFAGSETAFYIGRAAVALASDPDIMAKNGRAWTTGNRAREDQVTDWDGSQPDWGSHARPTPGVDRG